MNSKELADSLVGITNRMKRLHFEMSGYDDFFTSIRLKDDFKPEKKLAESVANLHFGNQQCILNILKVHKKSVSIRGNSPIKSKNIHVYNSLYEECLEIYYRSAYLYTTITKILEYNGIEFKISTPFSDNENSQLAELLRELQELLDDNEASESAFQKMIEKLRSLSNSDPNLLLGIINLVLTLYTIQNGNSSSAENMNAISEMHQESMEQDAQQHEEIMDVLYEIKDSSSE